MGYQFTSGDLRSLLSCLSLVRRKAVLFCLETGLEPEDVIGMRWKHVRGHRFEGFAAALINSMPRHLHLDYVFWEYYPDGQVAPLFGLRESIREASMGRTPETMRELYMRMTWLDMQAESDHFHASFVICE